jgi:cell division septation protein DedD
VSPEDTAEEDDGADDTDSATAGEGQFWIQLASLPLREKAERLAASLRKRGHKARAMAYGGPQAGWWHVVRLGPFDSRMAAETARLDFAQTERMKSEVIPRARGPFQIQLASVRAEKDAQSLAARLSRQGHAATVRTLAGSRGTWYAVRVGPFDAEQDAIAYQKLLEERSNVSGDILPRAPLPPAPAPSSVP